MPKENLYTVGRLAELGLLTATLTHEIRQPLFAIKSLAQLMQAKGVDRPELAELINQVGLLESLVEGVTIFARHTPATLAPVDPLAPVGRAIDLLRHRASRHRIRMRLESDERPPAARGDATALMQVMVNLLGNAIDASPQDGLVRVIVEATTESVRIEVLDEGPGIPAGLREKIFEPFFTTKPEGSGTGLGLVIARELVSGCGGQLVVLESEQGAHIRLRLPRWR